MAQCNVAEKPLLERIQYELEADPDLCDVTFSVGPQKTKVKALKLILIAASPVFKNEFKMKWNNAVVKNGEGIPMPEFNGKMFQLFVKLTSLDSWSLEVLQKLNLRSNDLLDLLSICRRYEMQTGVKNLKTLKAAFIQSFAKFKFADFLKLSQSNLKEVLASDDLPVDEIGVFKCALKWAEGQCKEKKIEASVDNLRHVLGDCLFEIRFPIMSNVDFTNAMELKELLNAEETLQIYKYVGSGDSKRRRYDVQSLRFNARRRKLVLPVEQEPNSAELKPQPRPTSYAQAAAKPFEAKPSPSVQPTETPTAKPLGCSTISLFSQYRKNEAKTSFVCDGKMHQHQFSSKGRVAVVGLGFAGPIHKSTFYDVLVEIKLWCGESVTGGTIKKSIFALKDQTFYFLFDQPITVNKDVLCFIFYSLKKWLQLLRQAHISQPNK